MTRRRSFAAAATLIVVGLAIEGVLLVGGVELGYRLAVRSVGPMPRLGHPAPLPPRVAASLWAAEVRSKQGAIPRVYAWNAYRFFGDEARSLTFAMGVARDVLTTAQKRGQVRGMLEWHMKGLAVTAWVTRNLTTDETVATYAQLLWMGELGRGMVEAARRLYGKELAALDYAQLALLVAISRSPRRYDPFRNPRDALEKRNAILQLLDEAGCFPAGGLAVAQSAPLGVVARRM